MPTADDILAELRAHRRDLATIFAARHDEDDEDAATKHEEEATRHDDEAARRRAAAKRAREDENDEEARGHDDAAKKAREDAKHAREEAMKRREADAKKAREVADEAAAKKHESAAKRLRDEEEAARKRHDDDEEEAKRHDESTAAKKKGMLSPVMPMLAMFLKAMTQNGTHMESLKNADNLALLHHMLEAMTYAPGSTGKRGQRAAKHDDEAEDTALFKRLMQQYTDDDGMSASRSVSDLRVERKLRSLEAAVGEMGKLLTDVATGMKNLATDTNQGQRDLVTDSHRGANGGPVRRTMSATGTEGFRGKFDGQPGTGQRSVQEIDAALNDENMDPVQRMATKLVLGWQGQIKD